MPRKARGARGRLASPAQIAKLEALLQMRLSQPVSFLAYRHMLRSNRHPDGNLDTELAAWENLEQPSASAPPPWWPQVGERAAGGEA